MKAAVLATVLLLAGCKSPSYCEIRDSDRQVEEMRRELKKLSDLSAETFFDLNARLRKLEEECR